MRDAPKERDLPARGLKELCVAASELRGWGRRLWALSLVEEDSGRLGGSLRCFPEFQRSVWCAGSIWVYWILLWVADREERSCGASRGELAVWGV